MPALAREMGVHDSFDPREKAVDRYHAVPPFRETERYVKAITSLIARDRAGAWNESARFLAARSSGACA